MREAFSCSLAISRNIGCVAVKEQGVLRRKRVAIAGMSGMSGSGGAGDVYLLTVGERRATQRWTSRTFHWDAYRNKLGCTLGPGRNILPLQRITLMIQIRQNARLRSKA